MRFVGKTHLQIITSTRYLENTVSEHKHRVDGYFENQKTTQLSRERTLVRYDGKTCIRVSIIVIKTAPRSVPV